METTLSRFLQNLLGTVPASTKLSLIEVVSKLAYREPKSWRWNEEFHEGQTKLFLFILLILLYSVLTK